MYKQDLTSNNIKCWYAIKPNKQTSNTCDVNSYISLYAQQQKILNYKITLYCIL